MARYDTVLLIQSIAANYMILIPKIKETPHGTH